MSSLKEEAVETWFHPEQRIEALSRFEKHLSTPSRPIPFEEVEKWIESRRQQDICLTLGNVDFDFDY